MMMAEDKDRHTSGASGNGENSAPSAGHDKTYKLRLFITGKSQRSQAAIDNIKEICQEHIEEHYDLEVIDIYQNPELARQYQILAVPTLLKELPAPVRKVIGDLSEKDQVLAGLNLRPK